MNVTQTPKVLALALLSSSWVCLRLWLVPAYIFGPFSGHKSLLCHFHFISTKCFCLFLRLLQFTRWLFKSRELIFFFFFFCITRSVLRWHRLAEFVEGLNYWWQNEFMRKETKAESGFCGIGPAVPTLTPNSCSGTNDYTG